MVKMRWLKLEKYTKLLFHNNYFLNLKSTKKDMTLFVCVFISKQPGVCRRLKYKTLFRCDVTKHNADGILYDLTNKSTF